MYSILKEVKKVVEDKVSGSGFLVAYCEKHGIDQSVLIDTAYACEFSLEDAVHNFFDDKLIGRGDHVYIMDQLEWILDELEQLNSKSGKPKNTCPDCGVNVGMATGPRATTQNSEKRKLI